jgi:hypothetical protein
MSKAVTERAPQVTALAGWIRQVPSDPKAVTGVLVALTIPLALLYGFDVGRPYSWLALRVVVFVALLAQLRGWGKPLAPRTLALIVLLIAVLVATFFVLD